VKTSTSTQKQYPVRSAASHPGKVKLATVYMLPFATLAVLAMWMQLYAEEGSPEWTLGSKLFVSAAMCGSFVVGFLGVLILYMMIPVMPPKAKGMQ
jgi:hypothetical protein